MVRVCRVVPKEWTKYQPVGQVIPNTRFVVFKTPLNDRLSTKIPRDKHFNINHLMRIMAERGQRLGLVVDLTDTERYYDRNDIEGMCISYEKVFCAGRGFADCEEYVEQFNSAIQRFIDGNDDSESLIGVHCTDGVNRAGYLVCRFLIERLGWSSHEAIDAFETARGHAIEKGSYVQALHRAAKEFKGRNRFAIADSDEDSDRSKNKKKRKRKRDEEMPFGAGVMGEMMQQFLGAFQQTEQSSPASGSPVVPQWQHVQNGVGEETPKERYEQEQYEEDTQEEARDHEEIDETTEEGRSRAAKRRARRQRLQHMYHVMKRGRFHEIQAVQAEHAERAAHRKEKEQHQ